MAKTLLFGQLCHDGDTGIYIYICLFSGRYELLILTPEDKMVVATPTPEERVRLLNKTTQKIFFHIALWKVLM